MSDKATVIVKVTRRFNATPERVFDAWLDPAKAKRFLFSVPGGEIVRAEIDARVGGGFLIVDRRDGEDVEHRGHYLELVRPHRLVFDFSVPKYSKQLSRVSIDIVAVDGGCELMLSHAGVLLEYEQPSQDGWNSILDGLMKLV